MAEIDIAVIQNMLDAMSAQYEQVLKGLDPRTTDFKFIKSELNIVNLAARYAYRKHKQHYDWICVNGRWLLESEQGKEVYRSSSSSCTCMAGLHGKPCKHIIIAQVLEQISEEINANTTANQ